MDPNSSPDPAPALSSDDQRDAALAQVLAQSRIRERIRRESVRPPGPPVGRWALALVLASVAVWLWAAPPPFLREPATPAIPVERADAGLRLAVALQSERVHAHRLRVRRLPDFLRELDDTLPGMSYRRLDGGTFLLRGSAGGLTLEYRSDESLSEFLGDSLDRLEANS